MTKQEKRQVATLATLFVLSFIALATLSNYVDKQAYNTCIELKTIEKKPTQTCEKIKEVRD